MYLLIAVDKHTVMEMEKLCLFCYITHLSKGVTCRRLGRGQQWVITHTWCLLVLWPQSWLAICHHKVVHLTVNMAEHITSISSTAEIRKAYPEEMDL